VEFDYALPAAAIAQEPAAEREASRLMRLERSSGEIQHHVFGALPDLLAPGDLLVVNRSRVFPARLLGRLKGGGAGEVLLVTPLGPGRWEALVRPGRRLRRDDLLVVSPDLSVRIEGEAVGPEGRRHVQLLAAGGDADAALEHWGHVPLPPYVRRTDRPEDRERYQTVYARERGSVAAPTAGLHFSHALLERLARRGVRRAELVLHVGPGTFRPVKAERIEDHRVEAEPYAIPPETSQAVRRTRAAGGRVVAVGTTVVRALETAARPDRQVEPGNGKTDLVIVPGYRFQVVDALITNFHLPRSSLLLLACAFGGRERVLAAYADAVRQGYRFYSYGDAMLMV
jgi:S-adenosylmethionine:tRNA ribosyltransferase-isomerase